MADYKKVCPRCGEEKPSSEFYLASNRSDGLSCWCKRCRRSSHTERLYGYSLDDYEKAFSRQDGRCALCGLSEKASLGGRQTRLSIDHDHETREVRGLLCRGCNHILGAVEKKPNGWLEKASKYLAGESD